MNEDKIRQIIHEEITKESPIKEIHLHVHGDEMKAFELLKEITSIQNALLETRVLERLAHLSEKEIPQNSEENDYESLNSVVFG